MNSTPAHTPTKTLRSSAAYWGISISDAKVRVEEKLAWGGNQIIKDTLAAAQETERR